jgi:hypothetical protein
VIDPCRCCGRTPEDILKAACTMRTLTGARFIAGELRTRWRHTLDGAVDLICWFCQLEAARFESGIARGSADLTFATQPSNR